MKLSEDQQDILCELLTIGVGEAASDLNEIVESHVTLSVPKIEIITTDQACEKLKAVVGDQISKIDMDFSGKFEGVAELLFPSASALQLVKLLSGETEELDSEFDALRVDTLTEIGNILLNGVMASFGNMSEDTLKFNVPRFSDVARENLFKNTAYEGPEVGVLFCMLDFSVESLNLPGAIILIFKLDKLPGMLNQLVRLAG